MNTIFYDQKYLRPFPLTLLMVERIEALNERGELDFVLFLAEYTDTPAEQIDEAVKYILSRFEKRDGADRPDRRIPRQKTFGHVISTMCEGMSLQDMLVMAFGLEEARRLYCEEDMDDALLALRMWQADQVRLHRMAWESALYAHGGKYKDDNGGEQMETIDMEAADGSGFDQLKAFVAQINGVFH